MFFIVKNVINMKIKCFFERNGRKRNFNGIFIRNRVEELKKNSLKFEKIVKSLRIFRKFPEGIRTHLKSSFILFVSMNSVSFFSVQQI
jgi:hypothetical protein